MRAVLVQAAKAWGQLPSDVGLCAPEDNITYMVAWEQAENSMTAWENQEREREQNRASRARR